MFLNRKDRTVAIVLGFLYGWILLPAQIFHEHSAHEMAECHAGDHGSASVEAICDICDRSTQKAVQLDLSVPVPLRMVVAHSWETELMEVPELRVHRIGDRGPPVLI